MKGSQGGNEVTPALTSDDFRSLYPSLRRFAATVGDSDLDPDDLVQDALAGYLRRFEDTDGATNPEAYLRSAILGLSSNHRRGMGRRRRARVEPDDHQVDIYPSDVRALLQHTSPEERALLLLVDVEGEPIAIAAEVIGIGTVAARARLSRVRRRLRTELRGEPDER